MTSTCCSTTKVTYTRSRFTKTIGGEHTSQKAKYTIVLVIYGYKTTLDLECFQINCTGTLCKRATINQKEL